MGALNVLLLNALGAIRWGILGFCATFDISIER